MYGSTVTHFENLKRRNGKGGDAKVGEFISVYIDCRGRPKKGSSYIGVKVSNLYLEDGRGLILGRATDRMKLILMTNLIPTINNIYLKLPGQVNSALVCDLIPDDEIGKSRKIPLKQDPTYCKEKKGPVV